MRPPDDTLIETGVLPLSRPALVNSTVVLATTTAWANWSVTLTVATTSGEEQPPGSARATLRASAWVAVITTR